MFEEMLDSVKNTLQESCGNILSDTFAYLNVRVNEVGGLTSQTPQSWNGVIFNFIDTLSDNVIIPIAGIIISYVLIYELISMIMDKNNFHEFDTSLFIRYIFKAAIAVMLVSHTDEIVEAIFEVGGQIAAQATVQITGDLDISVGDKLKDMLAENYADMELMELLGDFIMSLVVYIAVQIMGIYIAIIMYGRFMEIYLYMSVAPIPFATFGNKEWGQIGTNYIKSILGLAFQGFLIMACIGIYSTLISSLGTEIEGRAFTDALFQILIYTVLLAVTIGKTGSFAKSIFGAH